MNSAPILLTAVLLLTGCTTIPKYERPGAPIPAQFSGSTNTNTTDIGWRDFIRDERLRKLVEVALTNNRDLRVATLNVEKSRAQYRVTRSASLPNVEGTGSFTRSYAQQTAADSWSASIGTTGYEVDLWGRVRSLNREALEKYFATTEARRSAQLSLVAEVATQYFALRQAEEQIILLRQTLKTVQELYDLNQALFDAGATNELDLRTAEGQVQTAKINVLTYERQRAEAENALVLLIGQQLPEDLSAARPFKDTNLLAEVSPGLPATLVQRRPDILAAEHTLHAAQANIGAARAAFFPTITFTSSIGTTSEQFSKLFGAGSGVWTFSPQITLPIFDAGKNRADLDAANVSTRIEVANYEKAIQTAFREVSDALAGNMTYAAEIKERVAQSETQRRRFALANARYRQGEDSYLNVLSAQQDLYSAQQGRLAAQYNKLASQIALYKALGGGWK